MKSNKPKLWTKDFIIVSSTNFFIFLVFYVLMVTLTFYTMNTFHTSQSLAGLASSIFILGAVLIRPLAGKTIDSIGRKKMLFVSLVLFFITSVLYFQVNSLSMLFINRLIHGLAFGVATTATGTIVADIIPNERRGEGTGYYAMSTNLAMAFGPFIGLFITQHFSFSVIFIAATVFSTLGLVATLFLRVPKSNYNMQSLQANTSMKLSSFFEKTSVPISALVGLAGFLYSSILSFLTSYSQEIHLVSAASLFFVMFAVFLLATRPFTGRWFDVFGENVVMYPSIILFAIGLFLLSQAHIDLTLLAAGAIIGVGYGTFQSSTQAIVVNKAPHHRVGLATSTYFTLYELGIGVGPFLLGFVIPFLGYRGLYLVMAIVAFLCIFIYYAIHGRNVSKRKLINDESDHQFHV